MQPSQTVSHVAWMGGTRPAKALQCSPSERRYRSTLFRRAMRTVKEFWGDSQGLCDSVLEQARRQYNQAKYDAHASYRLN